jgi:hypothetical protein
MELLALERLRLLRLVEKINGEFSGKVWLPVSAKVSTYPFSKSLCNYHQLFGPVLKGIIFMFVLKEKALILNQC